MQDFTESSSVSAAQFLERLSPLNDVAWPETSNFIFRGQPDASFPLEPSAHRVDGVVTAPASFGEIDVTVAQQLRFEFAVVRQFLEGSDSCGLQVPGDSVVARHVLQSLDTYLESPSLWPPTELHQILAAAQHHGVPTCLLDWTRRQYVAAYFAASSALHLPKEPTHIALWAISTAGHSDWQGLRLIQTAGGTSVNLAAQSGLFTLSTLPDSPDELFVPVWGKWSPGFASVQEIRKLTLPFSEVKPLLRQLNKLGISAATLFPGYEGVARAVRDWAKLSGKKVDPNKISIRDLL